MFTKEEVKAILDNFSVAGKFVDFYPIDDGHITDTFTVVYDVG